MAKVFLQLCNIQKPAEKSILQFHFLSYSALLRNVWISNRAYSLQKLANGWWCWRIAKGTLFEKQNAWAWTWCYLKEIIVLNVCLPKNDLKWADLFLLYTPVSSPLIDILLDWDANCMSSTGKALLKKIDTCSQFHFLYIFVLQH